MSPVVLVVAFWLAGGPAGEPSPSASPPAVSPAGAAWTPLAADDQRLIGIKANAALVISTLGPLSQIDFGYDRASVAWVDGFIERQRVREGSVKGKMPGVLGSHLGEAIIARAGGQWAMAEDGSLGVRLPNGAWVFPIGKVDKQWDQGRENGESVLGFYEVAVDFVATGKLGG